MKKIHYLMCCMIVLLGSVVGVFSGCGGTINDLRVSLSSDSIVENEESGIYSMTLIKPKDELDSTWSATINAEVLGRSGNMSGKIGWTCDSRYIEVTPNVDGTSAVIKGVTSTDKPTQVIAYSIENRNAQAIINVTNIVMPKAIEHCKFGAGELGVPIGVATTLDPRDLFVFDPIDATIPEYEYNINGVVAYSGAPFMLSDMADGYGPITAGSENSRKLHPRGICEPRLHAGYGAFLYTIER